MGILTNIVAADEAELAAIGESLRPVDDWSGIEIRDFDTAKLATLHCLLTGDSLDEALVICEPVHASAEEGAIVLRIADEVLEGLVGIDEQVFDAIAAELAASEAFEMITEDEVYALVTEIADLARLADSQGQVLYVWMHPLK